MRMRVPRIPFRQCVHTAGQAVWTRAKASCADGSTSTRDFTADERVQYSTAPACGNGSETQCGCGHAAGGTDARRRVGDGYGGWAAG